MKTKKFLSVLLMTLLILGAFAGCGSGANAGADGSTGGSSNNAGGASAEAEGTGAGGNYDDVYGKTLVVYFSATGNTKETAGIIAKVLSAETFELVAAEPYTDDDLDYNDSSSRVYREHDDESLQDVQLVADTVDNWASYETVFIGYPIWWGGAAWPVNDFVKSNDFTGKTVIPFCTSGSSGIGSSGTALAAMAGTGNWLSGQRFSGGASESEVTQWLEEMEK